MPPGETPPDSGSTTGGVRPPGHDSPRRLGPLVIGVVLGLAVLMALFFLLRIFDLF